MAPSRLGAQFNKSCEGCRFPFDFDAVSGERDELCVCPNCGYAQSFEASVEPGDQVAIVSVSELKRGQIVAFEGFQRQAKRRMTKRIVGLPGEVISLHDGDVIVSTSTAWAPGPRSMNSAVDTQTRARGDGSRRVKNWESLRDVAVLVYDDRYVPKLPGMRRLRPVPDVDSPWQAIQDGYRWVRGSASQSDVLTYHHSEGLPPPFQRGTPMEMRDNYAYNQFRSRRLQTVSDWFVTLQLGWNGDVHLELQLHAKDENCQLKVDLSENRIAIRTPAGDREPTFLRERNLTEISLATGYADDHWFVVVNDEEAIRIASSGGAKHVDEEASHQLHKPFRLRAFGGGILEVRQLKIWRDVYYVGHPSDSTTNSRWKSRKLESDEYLLLGDNSPISRDARDGDEHGIVRRDQIIGVVHAIP